MHGWRFGPKPRLVPRQVYHVGIGTNVRYIGPKIIKTYNPYGGSRMQDELRYRRALKKRKELMDRVGYWWLFKSRARRRQPRSLKYISNYTLRKRHKTYYI